MIRAIPVNVLTGFLGSGKTTLLNRLLQSPGLSNCAVLINEFGLIGVDHHLVNLVANASAGQAVLLPSGCVCCTVRGDLAMALRDLFAQREAGSVPAFDRVIVETTGLADPVPVLATLLHDRVLRHHFRAGNVITTVDALNGAANLDEHAACRRQAALADRLVPTKLDLAAGVAVAELLAQLQALNPTAAVVRCAPGPIDAEALLGHDLFDPQRRSAAVQSWFAGLRNQRYLAPSSPGEAESRDDTHGDIRSFALELPPELDWPAFAMWLSLLLHVHGRDILRVKGLLGVAGTDTPVVLHGVQQLVYPPVHLSDWPGESRESVLVFIVRGIEPARIEASLQTHLSLHARPAAKRPRARFSELHQPCGS